MFSPVQFLLLLLYSNATCYVKHDLYVRKDCQHVLGS